MIEEHEKHCKDNDICRFCEKETVVDKVRGHCNLSGRNKGPAHQRYNINVTQKQNKFLPFTFLNLSL